MHSRPLAAAGIAALAVLILAGCTAEPAPAATTNPPVAATSTPSPSPEELVPDPIEADATLVIRAVATAADGAQLSLQYQVHQSTRWDDVAAENIPVLFAEVCPELLSLDQLKQERWSFTRSNLTAIPVEGTSIWPAGASVDVRPSAESGFVVARGFLVTVPAEPQCQGAKSFTTAGKGGMALGLAGDAAESGGLTGWTLHPYGFRTGPDVTLSACTIEVTQLGLDTGAGGPSWSTAVDDHSCLAGAADQLGA